MAKNNYKSNNLAFPDGVGKMSPFEWTEKRELAALSLAKGEPYRVAADTAGVSERTLFRWMKHPEFSLEVDRMSCMIETANRAHRLRVVNRVIRQMVKDDEPIVTTKDLLDWLKYAQSETDGLRLGLMEDTIEFVVRYGDVGGKPQ